MVMETNVCTVVCAATVGSYAAEERRTGYVRPALGVVIIRSEYHSSGPQQKTQPVIQGLP